MPDAEIRHLHTTKRQCGDCSHSALGQSGVFCRVFNEDIFDEKVAEECSEFEAMPSPGPVTIVGSRPDLDASFEEGAGVNGGPGRPEISALHDRANPPEPELEVIDIDEVERSERLLSEADLTSVCERFIEGRHATLFGEIFMVKSGEATEAAQWLARMIREVAAFAAEEVRGASTPDQHADEAGPLRGAERNGHVDGPTAAAHPAQGEPSAGGRGTASGPVPEA